MDPVMYIFVNADLHMSKGKTAAQCCHVVGKVTEDLIRQAYETYPPPPQYITFMKWRSQCTKIIYKATYEQLLELKELERASYIIDSGDRLPDNSLTVVGFYPGTDLGDRINNFKLY